MVAATSRAPAPDLPWPSEPMLAKSTDHLPAERELPGGSSYEPKWDGFRALLGIDGNGHAQLRSRRGTDLTRSFPDIAGPAAAQLPPGTLLDGELVIWGGAELDFSALQKRIAGPSRAATLAKAKPASYLAFDIIALHGTDLTDEPLRIRRRKLQSLVPQLKPPLQITPATKDRAIAENWLRDYADAAVGVEGLVIKGLGTRYHPGRRGWLKLRTTESAEAIVGAVGGTLRNPDRLILGRYTAGGELVVVGGTGPLKPGQQRDLATLLELPKSEHPWPVDVPTGEAGVWGRERKQPVLRVEPNLVVEVEAGNAYANQGWRHIVRLLRTRPDLSPDEIDLA